MNGTGTESDPYVISSIEDLALLSGDGYASYSGSSKHFVLGSDLDFNGVSFTPIGDSSHGFNGKFHGNFHVISNMVITGDSGYLGLFSRCAASARIEKMIFKNCTVTDSGTTGYVGMLAGRAFNGNTMVISCIETEGCSISTGGNYAGGLIGMAARNSTGAVQYSHIYVHGGSVVGSKYLGGICGYGGYNTGTSQVLFSSCRVQQEVIYSETASTDVFIGGIAGMAGYTAAGIVFSGCSFESSVVRVSGKGIGGFIGTSGASVTATFSSCRVDNCYLRSNSQCVGGFAGYNPDTGIIIMSDCSVTRCLLYGSSQVGGIIGGIKESSSQDTYTIVNPIIKNNCMYAGSTTGNAGGVIGYITAAS